MLEFICLCFTIHENQKLFRSLNFKAMFMEKGNSEKQLIQFAKKQIQNAIKWKIYLKVCH